MKNVLRLAGHLGTTCRFAGIPDPPRIVIDPDTGLVTVEVTITLKSPFDGVAKAIDPQNWDEGGQFFYPNGAYIASPNATPLGAGGPPPPAPMPPSGSAYGWAVLYERFRAVDPDGHEASFSNLLWVDTERYWGRDDKRRYVASYLLDAPLSAQVGAVQHVTILRDDGELKATELEGGETRVRMCKRIRFESDWANYATYVGFRFASRDLAGQLRDTASASVP